MKRVSIIILFICIGSCLFYSSNEILKNKSDLYNFKQYYNEKNIDVLFLGSSKIYWSLSPMEIWNKYGIITYNRGTTGQYYKLSYDILIETLKKNNIKVVVFDITFLLNNIYRETMLDLTLLNMNNSFTKINSILKYCSSFDCLNNRFNVMNRFHSRWKYLSKYDFINEEYWKGQYSGSYNLDDINNWTKIHIISQQKEQVYPLEDYKLHDDVEKYIIKFNELAKKYNFRIIFTVFPASLAKSDYLRAEAFVDIVKKYNLTFINYNKFYSEIHFDFNKDLRDYSHLNLYGSRKVMDHLIPYIIEHYNIPNRKNDPNYASWNEDYIKYARAINREEIRELKSFTDWKKQAFYDNYTVMISTHGDVLKKLPDTLKNDLSSFGLNKYNTDKANMRYAAIIDDNKVFFEEISNKPVTYKGRMKNIVNLLVASDGKATINVSGKPRSKNKYGLNFVIYDKVNREIVDSIWVDPRKPDEVRR